MAKKQVKSEFPNEVDILRTTLAELKVKLPGLDIFLLANPVSHFGMMRWWLYVATFALITVSFFFFFFFFTSQECTKCSNSKDYHCVPLKDKPGCRTCTSRRISCSRHVQYLVETAASRLEWSVEKTKSMYDKYVKQTRTGKKSPSKVKRLTIRKIMVSSSIFLSAQIK